MAFDIKRAESIAYGYKEWIHKGQKTFEQSVKEIKETYREDMAKEIIRILEREIKEVEEKVKWALVFTDVKEAEEAREKLAGHNIYPDSQEEYKLLWTDKEEAEYAREHVGGLIEPRYRKPKPRLFETKEPAEVTVKRLERGLLLVCRGFPPAGEKLEILWYGFKEEMAKRHAASNHPAYVYQLVYATEGPGVKIE